MEQEKQIPQEIQDKINEYRKANVRSLGRDRFIEEDCKWMYNLLISDGYVKPVMPDEVRQKIREYAGTLSTEHIPNEDTANIAKAFSLLVGEYGYSLAPNLVWVNCNNAPKGHVFTNTSIIRDIVAKIPVGTGNILFLHELNDETDIEYRKLYEYLTESNK